MLVEWLWQVKESVDRHGIRWGLIFAFYAILRKERRNYRLDKRDEIHNASFVAILKNQQTIMKQMGVQPCADTLTLITKLSARNTSNGYISSRMEELHALFAARKAIWSFIIWNIGRVGLMGKLVENLTSKKLWAFVLLVVLNGLNDTLQLHLSAETINNVTQGGTAYIVVQGVVDAVMAYVKKGGAVNGSRVLPEDNR